MTFLPIRIFDMWLRVLASFERRFEMTPSGMSLSGRGRDGMGYYYAHRTLATDHSFKERVREDMLVRLLDAFVWRNQGI